ncbi:class I SAM-dependent methyltransferase [Myxococcota bacterium]
MKMTNRWNRFVYRLWAPIYDALLERLFGKGRKMAMAVAAPDSGERLCFIGVGTGSDLLLLPERTAALGIDLSEPMLAQAKKKLPLPNRDVALRVGDAQSLPIGDEEEPFDIVILNLILSVVPDARQCLAEALRIIRPGGRIVVFDKFLPDNSTPSLSRRLANIFSTLFGTNINRRLGDVVSGHPCRIEYDEPSILGGMYRVVLLSKVPEGDA